MLALNEVIKRGPFALGSGDTDLYQAFAWRNWQLLSEGGRFGIVLPRGALSGSALTQWRREILANGSFADVCFLVNNQQWVFPEVHPQYTIGLTVSEKGSARVVRWAGPFASERDFLLGASNLAEVPANEFLSWSKTVAFPLIPDPISAQIFRQMKQSPRFDEVRADWDFRPITELHATGDKAVMEFDVDEPKGRIPIDAGASFNLWSPDYGTPYAYIPKKVLRPYLGAKAETASRNSRSALFGMHFTSRELPCDRPRIAFRDITRATDTRTAIACLLPPGTATVHNAPALIRRSGTSSAEAFLLGVMCTIPFDWGARRWVELHLTYEVLFQLPVPLYTKDSPLCARVAEIAGTLAAIDDRYEEWASEVGVPVGSVKTQTERDGLLAELDALVSLLYGLDENQVEHLFATFHRGWKFEPRLDSVLQHYRTRKGKV